jgi:outer membrane protein assembly factor BamE (lipoprotein component of BamABCDE complex)
MQASTMTMRLKVLMLCLLLGTTACVAAGNRAIKDAGTVAQIAVGQTTKADVTALLGYPIWASYGAQGEETWYYYCITTAPYPTSLAPTVKAFTPSLFDLPRQLGVTFNRDGVVSSLEPLQPHPGRLPSG